MGKIKIISFSIILILFGMSIGFMHEVLLGDKAIENIVEQSKTRFYGVKVECTTLDKNDLCNNYPYVDGSLIAEEQLNRLGCVFNYGDHVESSSLNTFCELMGYGN